MDLRGKEILVTLQIEEREGYVSAFCPELNLRDHGENQEEATAQLMKSIWLFMRVCASKGTLYKVLKERRVLREGSSSGQVLQIPISWHLFESKRAQAQ